MENPFGTGFDLASMTAAINKLPNLYSRTATIFRPEPITTASVIVEQLNGTLNIVRTRPRGAPADKPNADKRQLRSFVVPHIPVEDTIRPEDVQGVRAFGTEGTAETVANVMARKLQKMRNQIDQTREYLRMGALKGIILDADGTVLYNLYNEFKIQAAAVPTVGSYLSFAWNLNVNATDVLTVGCLPTLRHMEMNLRGETMTGVHALCSSGFFTSLISHPKVKEAFQFYSANNQNLAGDYRRRFVFGGITFEEYLATWVDVNGAARPAIAANTAHFYPEGTGDTFVEIFAPGDFDDTVNTPGQPYYARQEPKKYGKGTDVWAESNVLPMCKRPEVLATATVS